MNNAALIERMARETGMSIAEATKALNGLMGKGLIKPSKKRRFPFKINMKKVTELAKRKKDGNRK